MPCDISLRLLCITDMVLKNMSTPPLPCPPSEREPRTGLLNTIELPVLSFFIWVLV